jgi:hypothetical protein
MHVSGAILCAWWSDAELITAFATLALALITLPVAWETRRSRRNLTRPELIDAPSDPAQPSEKVFFGRSHAGFHHTNVASNDLFCTPTPGSDEGSWGCTFVVRNAGPGTAKILRCDMEARSGAYYFRMEGRSKRQFVAPRESARLTFNGIAPEGWMDAVVEGMEHYTAHIRYVDFEERDEWESTFTFIPIYSGLREQQVRIVRTHRLP